jgi:hypothetical protein
MPQRRSSPLIPLFSRNGRLPLPAERGTAARLAVRRRLPRAYSSPDRGRLRLLRHRGRRAAGTCRPPDSDRCRVPRPSPPARRRGARAGDPAQPRREHLRHQPRSWCGTVRRPRPRARAIKHAFAPDGISTWSSNERGANQEVPHFHLHVYPRRFGVPFPPAIQQPELTVSDGVLGPSAERIRRALEGLRPS